MNAPLLIELDKFLKENNLELQSTDFDFITSITWKTSIELKCKNCGHIFSITVKQLIRPHPERTGLICPRCNAEILFIKKLEELYNRNPYEFITKFEGYNEPLCVKCKDCNNIWTTKGARNLLIGKEFHPCKMCSNKRNFKKEIIEFENMLVEKFGVCNYEFKTDIFTGAYSKKKIRVKCLLCNNEFDVSPFNILNPKNGKHYCKYCNPRGKKKKEE